MARKSSYKKKSKSSRKWKKTSKRAGLKTSEYRVTGAVLDRFVQKTNAHYTQRQVVAMGVGNNIGNGSYCTWYGTGANLNKVAWPSQGDSYLDRTGDRIKVLGYLIEGFVTTSTQGDILRIMGLKSPDSQYFQNTSAALTAFEGQIDNGGLIPYSVSWLAPQSDVKCVYDEKLSLNPSGGTGTRSVYIRRAIPMNSVIKFTPTTATLSQGGCGIYMCSNDATSSNITFTGTIRMYFKSIGSQ